MPTRFELANAIRALAMDAVQRANSGHPGMPMGMADIAEVLWNDYLHFNPADPAWFNRLMVPIGLFLLFLTGVGPLFAFAKFVRRRKGMSHAGVYDIWKVDI